jgi:hypothetical protein
MKIRGSHKDEDVRAVVEQEKKPFVDQEDVRETQQPWWKRTKEEVDSSSSELGHGEWSYDPELE